MILCLGLAFFKVIPLQVLWSQVHQYQMILLLPLLGSFIPLEVTDMLLRSDFLWLPFAFVNLAKLFGIKVPDECTRTYEYENHARLHYDCFLINIFQVVIPLLLILLLALGVFLMKRYSETLQSNAYMMTLSLTLLLSILTRYFIVTFTFLIHSSIASLASLSVKDSYNIISLLLNLIYIQVGAFMLYVLIR